MFSSLRYFVAILFCVARPSAGLLKGVLAAALTLSLFSVAGATSSNQVITRGFIYANIGSLFTWSGSAQTSWFGSSQAATYNDFETYVKNSGSCGGSAKMLISYGAATGCAVNTSTHSPIVSCASFSSGCFSPWINNGVPGDDQPNACVATAGNHDFQNSSGGSQDGDGYSAGAAVGTGSTNGGCVDQFELYQSFSVSGTPTSQSYSFWVDWSNAQSAGFCKTAGSATVYAKLNGTVIVSNVSAGAASTWNQFSGSTSALVNGTNTLEIVVSLKPSYGSSSSTNCTNGIYNVVSNDTANVDNISLTATY